MQPPVACFNSGSTAQSGLEPAYSVAAKSCWVWSTGVPADGSLFHRVVRQPPFAGVNGKTEAVKEPAMGDRERAECDRQHPKIVLRLTHDDLEIGRILQTQRTLDEDDYKDEDVEDHADDSNWHRGEEHQCFVCVRSNPATPGRSAALFATWRYWEQGRLVHLYAPVGAKM